MDPTLQAISVGLAGNLLTIAQQGVANNQAIAHLTQLSFLNKQTEMDLKESFAAQGLQQSKLPGDLAGYNAADRTPTVKVEPK